MSVNYNIGNIFTLYMNVTRVELIRPQLKAIMFVCSKQSSVHVDTRFSANVQLRLYELKSLLTVTCAK